MTTGWKGRRVVVTGGAGFMGSRVVGANRAKPGRFLHENLRMGAQCLEEAFLTGVKKLVPGGSNCTCGLRRPEHP